ncbi:ABC transporter substrate-binding protein [Bradyrhizobium yuanmingense]|uniref:ABC transporter substrate-binding protein n=1 Tax=Bradyrhizobium yuanmingense TaxID=108015 RepID=UPI0023B9384C|nr:ABC transporter substrate-binding protein [Bradyrhizobium yuanmingense]MDF0579253.1 ABC transporter substrate-binding protein [Bradyrhizobium yuanmingense]
MVSTLINRRHLLRIVCGGAAHLPLALRAEDGASLIIGFLDPRSSTEAFSAQIEGFRRGLRDTGFIDGQNVTINYQWANDRFDRLPAIAQNLARQSPAVIVASGGTRVAMTVKETTSQTPVVFVTADDPVKLGLVASLSHPGGNMTGVNYFNVELYGKRLELLHRLTPKAKRIAVLVNPADPATAEPTLREVKTAASAIGLAIEVLKASSDAEIEAAFAGDEADALYIGGDVFLHSRRTRIAELAVRKLLPSIYPQREWAEAGGLMSYGTNFADIYRQAGVYAGRILNGERAATLPVMQPSRFELVINLKTANALGLTVPETILALADEVIE